MLKIPKMIMFDYGHTLVYEDNWDSIKGNKALLEYAVSNKNNITAEQAAEFADNLFKNASVGRKYGLEFHEHQFQKLFDEYLEIEINLSPPEREVIFWNNASPAHAMPDIKETLDYLYENNIRAGVISNMGFSGESLKSRIDGVLPAHHFEFIIASSEYIFRKPNKIIFELALKKANLKASEVWYCGDSIEFDVIGANSAGIFPVLYESELECWYKERGKDDLAGCEYLHIKNWLELIEALESKSE